MPPQIEALLLECVREHARVGDDALLVRLELRLERLAEADRLCGDDMLERAALCAGEDGLVKLLCQFLIVRQDNAAARTAQRLVRGGGDDIRVGNRTLVQTGSHQTGNVRHIDHQVSAVAMCDLGHFLEVDGTRICGCTCNDQLRAMLLDSLLKLSVVDEAILVYAVGNKVVVLAGLVDRRAVAQVTALRQIHTHNSVAQIEQSEVNRKVGLCTGVRLYVGPFCAEDLFQAVDGNLLTLVHYLTTTIVTLAGVSFSILVGEAGAHCLHNLVTYKVL